MNRLFFITFVALSLSIVWISSGLAAPITGDTKIAFDIQNSVNSTTQHSIPGLLVDANSYWNLTQSDISAGSVRDVTNTVVDGVSVSRFGSTWSNWGSVVNPPESNAVTQDYLFDNNAVNVNGYHSLWTISGLDTSLRYDLAIHANRIQSGSNGNTDGATVYIGEGAPVPTVIASVVLPYLTSNANAVWPDGGFEAGITSAHFKNLAPDTGGNIWVYFNKGGSGAVIFTGAELTVAVPEPQTFALAAFGVLGVVLLMCRRVRGRE